VDNPTQILYDSGAPVLVLRAVTVRVVHGPDVDASCRLAQSRLRVGTSRDNDLHLSDPSVSRHHLEFQVQDLGYLVRDMQSTNGTFYRGARIAEALLAPGAEVRLGSTVLRLEVGEQESEVIVQAPRFGRTIGTSPAMRRVFGILSAVAPTDVTVLLEGETGTGKELVADEIHRLSPRRDGPFSVVDCGALPAGLIESELFGHEKGAFTGAVSERVGVFEKAHGGTVFLDEIGELPLELQTRLLRVLEQRTIKRVGSNLPRKVDVRLVAATNRELTREVAARRFREDLFYRLAVIRVPLPPLRDRREDIPELARQFLWQVGCSDPDRVLTQEVLRDFMSRAWPGNIRELRNVIERAVLLADGVDLGDPAGGSSVPQPPPVPEVPVSAAAPAAAPREDLIEELLHRDYKTAKELLLAAFERRYLERLVMRHGSNISRIAQEAGVDRHAARTLLRKHELIE